MSAIDLYVVPPSPPCRAVIIAAKNLNIPVNIIYVDLMKGQQKEDWFVKMNPQHCLPTINDNGFILWESRAIMTYFANKYASENPIYPVNAKQRAIVDRMMQYDLNVLYRSLVDFLIPAVREGRMTQRLSNPIKERKVIEAFNYLDEILEQHQYVASNDLTLADFSIYCSLEFADDFQYDFKKYKNLFHYYHRLKTEVIDNSLTKIKEEANSGCPIIDDGKLENNTEIRDDLKSDNPTAKKLMNESKSRNKDLNQCSMPVDCSAKNLLEFIIDNPSTDSF